jgi:hypothetical protein
MERDGGEKQHIPYASNIIPCILYNYQFTDKCSLFNKMTDGNITEVKFFRIDEALTKRIIDSITLTALNTFRGQRMAPGCKVRYFCL